jgi:hypothetical protein
LCLADEGIELITGAALVAGMDLVARRPWRIADLFGWLFGRCSIFVGSLRENSAPLLPCDA